MGVKDFYCSQAKLEPKPVFNTEEIAKLAYEVPLYVEGPLKQLVAQNNVVQANRYLEAFFAKEDLKYKVKDINPMVMFEEVSPKHVQFQEFRSRIQFIQGANKTGKSGNGSKKVVDLCLGRLPNVPFHLKPEPNKVMYGWVCNEFRDLIQSAINQLKKWMTPDQYVLQRGQGGKIDKITIKAANGGITEITVKPYDAGVEAFESDNIHFIWCDEPPPLGVFEAMWGRLVEFKGWMMITATTVQEEARYLHEMINGRGEKAELYKLGLVQHLRMTIWENYNLSRRDIDEFVAGFPPGSAAYKSRVFGEFGERTGKVFEFEQRKFIEGEEEAVNWHVYTDEELSKIKKKDCVLVGGLDYGRRDPFAAGMVYFDGENIFLDDVIYQKNLEASAQGELLKQMFIKHNRIPMFIVADRQIANEAHEGKNILGLYLDALGDEYRTYFRCEANDKKNPEAALAWLGDKLMQVNPNTGKPYLRIHARCVEAIDEFLGLSWKESNANLVRAKELTKGKDHVISFMKYMANSGIFDSEALLDEFAASGGIREIKSSGYFIDDEDAPQDESEDMLYY